MSAHVTGYRGDNEDFKLGTCVKGKSPLLTKKKRIFIKKMAERGIFRLGKGLMDRIAKLRGVGTVMPSLYLARDQAIQNQLGSTEKQFLHVELQGP